MIRFLRMGAKKAEARGSKGFTLVELLIVVTIVGILSVAGITAVDLNIQRAKRSEAYNSIGQIKRVIDVYLVTYEDLPKDLDDLVDVGFIAHPDAWDGEYYNHYEWPDAGIDPVTKRFDGTIRARPRPAENPAPPAEIRFEGATGRAHRGPDPEKKDTEIDVENQP